MIDTAVTELDVDKKKKRKIRLGKDNALSECLIKNDKQKGLGSLFIL